MAAQVADRILVKLVSSFLDEHPHGVTVKDVTQEFGMSADAARKILGGMVDAGDVAHSPRPGEGAGLYRRPSTVERDRNAWLNLAKRRLQATFGDAYHLSIASGEPMVTLPLAYLDDDKLHDRVRDEGYVGPWEALVDAFPTATPSADTDA